MSNEPNGQPPAEKNGPKPLAVDSSAQMKPSPIEDQTEVVFGIREATTGAIVLPFPRRVVTGDFTRKAAPETADHKPAIVTGDYRPAKASKPATSERKKTAGTKRKKSASIKGQKPKIPGCEVVPHGAGWNVFRVWYDPKQPGEKWPKKHRAYESYLTQSDINEGKELGTYG
ncbi:MAG: hypothetical protein ACRD82_22000, partial [Blastocatellia bacterium]